METIHCGEGIPRRCYKVTSHQGPRLICICYNQWTTLLFDAYPKHPGPDPAPHISVEGIPPESMRQIKILDLIHYLSASLDGHDTKAIRSIISQSLKTIQEKLPEGVTIEELEY